MEQKLDRSALVVPYTMLEREALDWALLFFDSLIFAHPFPLPMPEHYQPLLALQRVRIWTAERTPPDIQKKDRWLREYKQFAAQNPEPGFLSALKQIRADQTPETRDEIVALLKGGPDRENEAPPAAPAVDGDLLLCLIHEHLRTEWEVDQSLAVVEKAEKNLMHIMDQGWEDGGDLGAAETAFGGLTDSEMVCPPALEAWRQLKNPLASESTTRLTTQAWVWRQYYGLDPEDPSLSSIPLPDIPLAAPPGEALPSSDRARVNQLFWKALTAAPDTRMKNTADLAAGLSHLGLPAAGRYTLVFPPDPATGGSETGPLVLLRRQ